MKTFLKKISYFFSILLFILLIVKIGTEVTVFNKIDFKLPAGTKYLMLGHSHSAMAYNDSIIKEFKNFGRSSESYFYTSAKTKRILQDNHSIEYILIEFTNNQLRPSMDDWIWDDKHINRDYENYFPLLNIEDHLLLFKNNPVASMKHSFFPKNNLELVFRNEFIVRKGFGGYHYLKRNRMDSILNNWVASDSIKHPRKKEFKQKSGLTENLSYLRKLIDMSREKGKTVFLVRSPLHKFERERNNDSLYQNIKSNYFNDVELLDFSAFPLRNDEFADLTHLNYKGARVYSKWINELLQDKLLNKTNKQEIINKEIEQFSKYSVEQTKSL